MAHACLGWRVSWDQRAKVDASCNAEDGGDVDGQLFGADGAGCGEAALDGTNWDLSRTDGVGESLDVLADHDFVNVTKVTLNVQTCNLSDEEHDFIVASHQL